MPIKTDIQVKMHIRGANEPERKKVLETLKKDFPEISSVFTRPNYVEFIIRQTTEANLDWEQNIKSRLILKGFNMGERALKSTDRNAMTRFQAGRTTVRLKERLEKQKQEKIKKEKEEQQAGWLSSFSWW